MANKNSRLLTTEEQWDIYSPPVLNQFERIQHFTLSPEEIKILKSFQSIEASVYFALCLVFLKLKKTLVNFSYQDVTLERQHVMERYFPTKNSPRSFPTDRDLIARIENKALAVYGYHRCTHQRTSEIQADLQSQAAGHPRQRKLCKTLLDLFVKHRVAIPPYSPLQKIVTNVWSKENSRIINAYHRHTNKEQRNVVLSLLDKADKFHRIVTISQDMKNFTNIALNEEIEKQNQLKPIFEIAKTVIPKLKLPTTTVNYYASLIDYYNGYRLKELDENQAQLYLLCYAFSKYQVINDNLLETLKKRTLDYKSVAVQYAKEEAAKQLEITKRSRIQASNVLIAIHDYQANTIPKSEIHKHIPQDELLIIARLLIDDNLDKDYLYWKYIDKISDAIKLSLRHLFLNIDFIVVNNDQLKAIVDYLKEYLKSPTKDKSTSLPSYAKSWIKKKNCSYVLDGDKVIFNRLEFLVYENIVHHISTNKLTLKYSIKHKAIQDDLLPKKHREKHHAKIIKETGYKKLTMPIKELLAQKRNNVTKLYEKLNESILNGNNENIKIITDKHENKSWRLRSLDKISDPNDSLFNEFNRRSIVDIIKFVNQETRFSKVFDSILPKQTKGEQDIMLIVAVILANAMRIGVRKMADISDLNESALITAETAYVRTETLLAAIDVINNAAATVPIFKRWYLNGKYHGSADGFKLEVEMQNMMARYSRKYLGTNMGISGYNSILNHFSMTGLLIGTNEYEGCYTFEMVEHQNASELQIDILSTDKHGTNAFNYGLFDLTDRLLAPRIPKPHRQIFWGFKGMDINKDYLIRPTQFIDEELIIEEWDNIRHLVASLITGEAQPNVIIKKLSSNNYSSRTKKAFMQYNNLVRTEFLLMYLHDREFRRAILISLNRGEAYNNLYRAIAILKKGAFRGTSKVEMERWNHCTRLISSIILYYNSYILNGLYENATDEMTKNYLLGLSPGAWIHINLLGYYQFIGEGSYEYIDRWIKHWRYQNHTSFVGKQEEEMLV